MNEVIYVYGECQTINESKEQVAKLYDKETYKLMYEGMSLYRDSDYYYSDRPCYTEDWIYHGMLTSIHPCRICGEHEEFDETLTCVECRHAQLLELAKLRSETQDITMGSINAGLRTQNQDCTYHKHCYKEHVDLWKMLKEMNETDNNYMYWLSKDVFRYMLEYVFDKRATRHICDEEHRMKELPPYMKDKYNNVTIRLQENLYICTMLGYIEYTNLKCDEPLVYIDSETTDPKDRGTVEHARMYKVGMKIHKLYAGVGVGKEI